MEHPPKTVLWACAAVAVALLLSTASAPRAAQTRSATPVAATQILGRPTAHSVAVSLLAPSALQAYAEYGTTAGRYAGRTRVGAAKAGVPLVLTLSGLKANARYVYRLRYRLPGASSYRAGAAHAFHTQRAPGSTFSFALQGDSHPERAGKMFDPALYRLTMRNVAAERPDFYVTLGDDFSVDPLIAKNQLTAQAVDRQYVDQRSYLGIVGESSPLFLVNGNHEQAEQVYLDGTPSNPAVLSGSARTRFFPLPAPDGFYGGDPRRVQYVGLLRDYYSWTWGDALFVVIDPYWHSPVQVDAALGGHGSSGTKQGRDLWQVSIGDAQYRWLRQTLERSTARFKFVFAHHVLGTGRGGVEEAGLYEWGGSDPEGKTTFAAQRPGWGLPIQQLFANTGVTVFFQGHDHLFARQQLDGVVYQETPNPADPTYTGFNRDAYRSGTILPNAGHLLVTVSPKGVRVEYVRSYLPKDESGGRKNGSVVYAYTVEAHP